MSILPQLEQNKGTVSSSLGKTLAQEVLAGDNAILLEAVELLAHHNKDVRAGAAKIIEQVAAVYPQRVVPFLPRLLPALEFPELQTRWMVIHTLGLCAAHDTVTALEALPKAQQFIRARSGTALWNATIVYLGYVGATSATCARRVFPLLQQVLNEIPDLTKAALESCLRLLDVADEDTQAQIARYAERYVQVPQPGIRASAAKIQKRIVKRPPTPAPAVKYLDAEIRHAIFIRAAPELVFDGLATSEGLNAWFTTRATLDAKDGGDIRFEWVDWGPDHTTAQDGGPVLEARRPERFVFQWHPDTPEYVTTVEITIQEAAGGTILRLRETGYHDTPAGRAAFAKGASGWGEALTLLKFYLEHGVHY